MRIHARALVASTLAAALLVTTPAGASSFAPDAEPNPELVELYRKGSATFDAADYGAAIESFEEGVAKAGSLGDLRMRAYFMVSLAVSHLKAYQVDDDATHLRQARDLLQRAIEKEGSGLDGPALEKARTNLDEVEARLAALESEQGQDGLAPVAAAPSEPIDPGPLDDPLDDKPPSARRKQVGLILMASGGGALAASIGAFLYAGLAPAILDGQADAPNQREYLDEEGPRVAAIWYGVGGGLAAVGLGLVIGGATLYVKSGRRAKATARVNFQPMVGPQVWGGGAHVRF